MWSMAKWFRNNARYTASLSVYDILALPVPIQGLKHVPTSTNIMEQRVQTL